MNGDWGSVWVCADGGWVGEVGGERRMRNCGWDTG